MEAIQIKILIGILIAGGLLGVHYVANRPIPTNYLPPVAVTYTPLPSIPSTSTPQPTYQPMVAKPVTLSTPDPDPIVSCNVGSNCGGYKQMRQNECRESVCCQVGSGWSLYPDKQSCTNAQVSSLPSLPAETPWPSLPPVTPYPSIDVLSNQQTLTDCLNAAKVYIEGPDFNVTNPNSAQLEMQAEDQQAYNNAVGSCHNQYGY